jgi:hypothetical protein
MNQVITLDSATAIKFRGIVDTTELRDGDGNVLGHFMPTLTRNEVFGIQPQISEEELNRRENEGGGRKLAEILADLESRA